MTRPKQPSRDGHVPVQRSQIDIYYPERYAEFVTHVVIPLEQYRLIFGEPACEA